MIPTIKELEESGFTAAARVTEQHRNAVPAELRQKLKTAFEHCRVVSQADIDAFAARLKKKTRKRISAYEIKYQIPVFTPIEQYREVPPQEVLVALQKAKELGCFDSYEILTLGDSTHQSLSWRARMEAATRDPVLFGRIRGSDNRYFIAQWDDDVAIEDILKEGEG